MARFSSNHLKSLQGEAKFTPNTVNAEGKAAYKDDSIYQSVARLALTGVLGSQYYKNENAVAKDLVDICSKMAKIDPIFLLKAAKVSRDLNMKLFPKLALAAAISETEKSKDVATVNETAAQVLSTYNPNQLLEFVLLMKERQFGKGLGSRTQKIVSRALGKINDRRLENMTISEREGLQRILRLVHPNLDAMVRYVLDKREGTENGLPLTERQRAMEEIKALVSEKSKGYESRIVELIKAHKLPFNALEGIVGGLGSDVWDAIADQMSVLQLFLNLKSLDEGKEVMSPRKLKALLDQKFIQGKTRILPLDVMRPYAMARAEYHDVLAEIVEKLGDEPVPGLEDKKVGLVLDGSGSMGGDIGSPWMNACALTIPFLTNCKDRHFMVYSNDLYHEGGTIDKSNYSGYDRGVRLPNFRRGLDNFNKLVKCFPNGGTDTGRAIQWYLSNRVFVDVLILITDEQQNGRESFYNIWAKYKAEVNRNAKLLVVNPTNYEWHLAPLQDKSVTIVQTLTPAVYRMVSYHGKDLVSVIKETDLTKVSEE